MPSRRWGIYPSQKQWKTLFMMNWDFWENGLKIFDLHHKNTAYSGENLATQKGSCLLGRTSY